MITRLCCLLALLWICSACSTLALREPLALNDPQVARALAALEANAAQRQALRAIVKIAIDGPRGSGRAKQVLIAQRPASLRIEVFGLMNQVVSLLVTDGENFSTYDASRNTFERGAVQPQLLRSTTGVDLLPQEVVQLVLAAPELPLARQIEVAQRLRDGGLALVIRSLPDDSTTDATRGSTRSAVRDFGDTEEGGEWRRRFEFDAALRLMRASALTQAGEPIWEAAFSDFAPRSPSHAAPADPATEFPRRMALQIPKDEIRVELWFSELELNPEFAENLFVF